MKRRKSLVLALTLLVAGCGGGGESTTTAAAATVEQYCAILAGAHERGSEETMEMLLDLDYPGAADLLGPLERREVDAEDFQAFAEFNEATCGVLWP